MQALFDGQFGPSKQFQIIQARYWAQLDQKL